MNNKKLKVAVGMSGGVDSTMAAYLLKESGHEVVGITMRIWQGESNYLGALKSGCYGPGETHDIADAQMACQRLGIPHHTLDLAQEFKAVVLKNFSSEYLAGRTPNPCVLCNHFIKFGALLERAHASGIQFDYFATGHYARIEKDELSQRFLLKKAADLKKDQSYFLYRLEQSQLAQTLFPLGESTKTQVKALAQKAGFAEIAEKPESQDFIDNGEYQQIFSSADPKPGRILDLQGRQLGNHQGIFNFTVGQRKGLNIGGGSRPLYVLRIDAQNNDVIVGPKESLAVNHLTAGFLNWIAIETLQKPMKARARLRSRQLETLCEISPLKENSLEVKFDQPQYTAAPGQSIVFYQEDVVLGGGIIQKVIKTLNH
jgi:tRNA-specific 2-thiouridylase